MLRRSNWPWQAPLAGGCGRGKRTHIAPPMGPLHPGAACNTGAQ